MALIEESDSLTIPMPELPSDNVKPVNPVTRPTMGYPAPMARPMPNVLPYSNHYEPSEQQMRFEAIERSGNMASSTSMSRERMSEELREYGRARAAAEAAAAVPTSSFLAPSPDDALLIAANRASQLDEQQMGLWRSSMPGARGMQRNEGSMGMSMGMGVGIGGGMGANGMGLAGGVSYGNRVVPPPPQMPDLPAPPDPTTGFDDLM